MNQPSVLMDLSGRVLLGLYFLVPGVMKITGFAGMQAYMSQHGVPLVTPLLLLTIVLLMPWILGTLREYTAALFANLSAYGLSG